MTSALLTLPLWMQFLAGFILLGLGLMFILMPFSIFGVKPRLEEVELQLNEVRAELRIIAMRLGQSMPETGPSGEPVYAPPRRHAAPADTRAAEAARAPDVMPWSSEASRQTARDVIPPVDVSGAEYRPPVIQRPSEQQGVRSGARAHEPSFQRSADDSFERPTERPVERPGDRGNDRATPLPAARDDYSYAESGAQENIERILRPTYFDPPPPREAPRPPRAPTGPDSGNPAPVADEAWRLKAHRPETQQRPDPQRPDLQRSDMRRPDHMRSDLHRQEAADRAEAHRQEMAPRGAASEAERLRQAEESGARRVRSEPTLRWPPRP